MKMSFRSTVARTGAALALTVTSTLLTIGPASACSTNPVPAPTPSVSVSASPTRPSGAPAQVSVQRAGQRVRQHGVRGRVAQPRHGKYLHQSLKA